MSDKRMLIAFFNFLIVWFLAASFAHSAPANKLIAALSQEPTTLDQSLAYTGPDYAVAENWGEYPVYQAPDGKRGPGLATSWEISPDGKVIEFTLRKGVKFHSGDPLTARDVEFSFERGRTKNSTVKSRLASMDRFEIIDDYRYRIHFKQPDVTFIPNRGGAIMVSKSYYDRVGEDEFVRKPVGTGPYKLASYVPGNYVDLERFEDYWGKKPLVKEARLYFVSEDTTRLAKLKAGEVDIITACPYSSVREIEKNPALKAIRLATNHPTVAVQFSTRNPNTPWHNRKVRLAMAYAVDCDAIVKNILYAIPNRWPFLAPHELGYDPNLKNYPYDPKKARHLLAEAGYPNGFEFKLYWAIGGEIPLMREVVEAAASYFDAVGIRTKLIGEEYAKAYARRRASKGPEAEYVILSGTGRAGSPDASYYLELFLGCEGGFSLYCNPEVDKVAAEAKTTMNDTRRAELIKKAVRMIHEDVASIPIFNPVLVYAVKANVDFIPAQGIVHNMLLVKDVTVK